MCVFGWVVVCVCGWVCRCVSGWVGRWVGECVGGKSPHSNYRKFPLKNIFERRKYILTELKLRGQEEISGRDFFSRSRLPPKS